MFTSESAELDSGLLLFKGFRRPLFLLAAATVLELLPPFIVMGSRPRPSSRTSQNALSALTERGGPPPSVVIKCVAVVAADDDDGDICLAATAIRRTKARSPASQSQPALGSRTHARSRRCYFRKLFLRKVLLACSVDLVLQSQASNSPKRVVDIYTSYDHRLMESY